MTDNTKHLKPEDIKWLKDHGWKEDTGIDINDIEMEEIRSFKYPKISTEREKWL